MAEKMKQLMGRLHQIPAEPNPGNPAGVETRVVHSAESGLNETCLPLFQLTELRTYPPNYGVDVIPLYQFLFHECVILQGMMGNAPEPYHLAIRNAVNGVLGGIPGGVLTGDGSLLDKDTNNWAEWQPKVENSANAFEMIRSVTALRRGPGKNYLVYGRMLRPAEVGGIQLRSWASNGRDFNIPTVFHTVWQAPDGKMALVLANWTTESQSLSIKDPRFQNGEGKARFHLSGQNLMTSFIQAQNGCMELSLPGLSCALLVGVE